MRIEVTGEGKSHYFAQNKRICKQITTGNVKSSLYINKFKQTVNDDR